MNPAQLAEASRLFFNQVRDRANAKSAPEVEAWLGRLDRFLTAADKITTRLAPQPQLAESAWVLLEQVKDRVSASDPAGVDTWFALVERLVDSAARVAQLAGTPLPG